MNEAEKELLNILNKEGKSFVSDEKDLTIIKYSLDNIKKICMDYKNCNLCPLGGDGYSCYLSNKKPREWNSPDKPLIKMFK